MTPFGQNGLRGGQASDCSSDSFWFRRWTRIDTRRARPTIRCLVEDLGIELIDLGTDLGALDDPWITELRRIAPQSPMGQKRILSIAHPLVYRLRVSSERGATWLDEEGVVWLCAVRRREEGSDDDAFEWFAELHQDGQLLPTEDDRLRDQAEEALRLFGRLKKALFDLVDERVPTSARSTWRILMGGCRAGPSPSRETGWRRSGAPSACGPWRATSSVPR